MITRRTLAAALGTTLVLAPGARGQGWLEFEYEVEATRAELAEFGFSTAPKGVAIHTPDTSKTGVLFDCRDDGRLRVFISLRPVEMRADFADATRRSVYEECGRGDGCAAAANFDPTSPVYDGPIVALQFEGPGRNTGRARTRTIRLTFNDTAPIRGDWLHLPDLDLVRPYNEETAYVIRDAVARGESLSLKMSMRRRIDVTPPPADETFDAFGRACLANDPRNE